MGFLNKLRPDAGQSQGQPEIRNPSVSVDEKTSAVPTTYVDAEQSKSIAVAPSEDSDNEEELVHKDMQHGVQKMEAMAQVWPKWALYATYAW